jgi:hypothetical protein
MLEIENQIHEYANECRDAAILGYLHLAKGLTEGVRQAQKGYIKGLNDFFIDLSKHLFSFFFLSHSSFLHIGNDHTTTHAGILSLCLKSLETTGRLPVSTNLLDC